MKITLDLVRDVLREALGFDSFTAGYITSVSEDSTHPTAGITKDGRLKYNPSFIDRYITCKEDLFSLIFHELLHPMFGHFIHLKGLLENIAADAIINAVISTLYKDQSADGNLFRKTHEGRGLNGLMRPGSVMYNSRYQAAYGNLYLHNRYSYGKEESITTGELIQTLKILTQGERLESVLLIGTHSDGSDLPKETLERIAEDIMGSVQEKIENRSAGYGSALMQLLMEALKTHLSIKRYLLGRFATKRKVDRFKEMCHTRRISVTPIPIHPSKRDAVLLAAGFYPVWFRNQSDRLHHQERGLAVYLDVSGSVNEYLPRILGVLRSLRNEITTIFQFSNKVVETSFADLLKGKIATTEGTDFTCVGQSILDRQYDKAVIITDGFAVMSDDVKLKLSEQKLQTLTILFGEGTHCSEFERFGDVLQLDEVCE